MLEETSVVAVVVAVPTVRRGAACGAIAARPAGDVAAGDERVVVAFDHVQVLQVVARGGPSGGRSP